MMTLISKWLDEALLALFCAAAITACVFWGLWNHSKVTLAAQSAQITTLTGAVKTAQGALKRSQTTTAKLSLEKQRLQALSQAQGQALADALMANQTWADTPVPKEVQNALIPPASGL